MLTIGYSGFVHTTVITSNSFGKGFSEQSLVKNKIYNLMVQPITVYSNGFSYLRGIVGERRTRIGKLDAQNCICKF